MADPDLAHPINAANSGDPKLFFCTICRSHQLPISFYHDFYGRIFLHIKGKHPGVKIDNIHQFIGRTTDSNIDDGTHQFKQKTGFSSPTKVADQSITDVGARDGLAGTMSTRLTDVKSAAMSSRSLLQPNAGPRRRTTCQQLRIIPPQSIAKKKAEKATASMAPAATSSETMEWINQWSTPSQNSLIPKKRLRFLDDGHAASKSSAIAITSKTTKPKSQNVMTATVTPISRPAAQRQVLSASTLVRFDVPAAVSTGRQDVKNFTKHAENEQVTQHCKITRRSKSATIACTSDMPFKVPANLVTFVRTSTSSGSAQPSRVRSRSQPSEEGVSNVKNPSMTASFVRAPINRALTTNQLMTLPFNSALNITSRSVTEPFSRSLSTYETPTLLSATDSDASCSVKREHYVSVIKIEPSWKQTPSESAIWTNDNNDNVTQTASFSGTLLPTDHFLKSTKSTTENFGEDRNFQNRGMSMSLYEHEQEAITMEESRSRSDATQTSVILAAAPTCSEHNEVAGTLVATDPGSSKKNKSYSLAGCDKKTIYYLHNLNHLYPYIVTRVRLNKIMDTDAEINALKSAFPDLPVPNELLYIAMKSAHAAATTHYQQGLNDGRASAG